MIELMKQLCALPGPSGCEDAVREFVLENPVQTDPYMRQHGAFTNRFYKASEKRCKNLTCRRKKHGCAGKSGSQLPNNKQRYQRNNSVDYNQLFI